MQPRIREQFNSRQALKAQKWIPQAVTKRLLLNSFHDTAWDLSEYLTRRRSEVRLLTPHFEPTRHYTRITRVIDRLLPERFSYMPHDRSSYTTETFLRDEYPDLYESNCNEFYWNRQPFAIHLHHVARYWERDNEKAAEIGSIAQTIESLLHRFGIEISLSYGQSELSK